MEWNANGLLRHQHELEVILSTENTDTCLISETRFTKESFILFKNYITYRTIHHTNTAKVGSAVIIRNNIDILKEKNV
jgi:exonuclease III